MNKFGFHKRFFADACIISRLYKVVHNNVRVLETPIPLPPAPAKRRKIFMKTSLHAGETKRLHTGEEQQTFDETQPGLHANRTNKTRDN